MACNQTLSGIAKDCTPSMGGIVEAYIAAYSDVTAVTVTDGKISAITLRTPGSGETGSVKFKRFTFRRNTSNFASTLNVDPAVGTSFVSTDIMLQFNRMETTKRVEMAALAVNELAVFVLDANGKYWYFGKDEAVCASAGDGQTGTARADGNRYTITLQDNAKEFPYEMNVGSGTGQIDLSTIVE